MDKAIKGHLKSESTWMRLLYTALFAIVFNIAEVVVVVVFAIQFLSRLFTGRVNERLRALGQTLAAYIYEIVLYVTFHSDERPYPFGPWPQGAPGARDAKPAKPAKPRPPRKRKTPPAKPAEEAPEG